MFGFIKKIKDNLRHKRKMRQANSNNRMRYYLHKTRSQKKSSRAY